MQDIPDVYLGLALELLKMGLKVQWLADPMPTDGQTGQHLEVSEASPGWCHNRSHKVVVEDTKLIVVTNDGKGHNILTELCLGDPNLVDQLVDYFKRYHPYVPGIWPTPR
jgi:hypothetical protein